jgi:hypothetical protein
MSIYEIGQGIVEFVKEFPVTTGAIVLTVGGLTTKLVYDIKHMKKVEKELKEVVDTYKNDPLKRTEGIVEIANKYPEVKKIITEYLKSTKYDSNNNTTPKSSNNSQDGIEKIIEDK